MPTLDSQHNNGGIMQRKLFLGLVALSSLLAACGERPPGIDNTCEDYGSCDVDGDGWARADGDCDDDNAAIHPGADEIWYDGVDQDCSGTTDFDADDDGFDVEDDCDDEDPQSGEELDWYFDADGDGFGNEDSLIWACDAPSTSWVALPSDCDDSDPYSYPGANEVNGDGIDQDCDGYDSPADSETGGTDEEDDDSNQEDERGL
jgi:hypothetical protein